VKPRRRIIPPRSDRFLPVLTGCNMTIFCPARPRYVGAMSEKNEIELLTPAEVDRLFRWPRGGRSRLPRPTPFPQSDCRWRTAFRPGRIATIPVQRRCEMNTPDYQLLTVRTWPVCCGFTPARSGDCLPWPKAGTAASAAVAAGAEKRSLAGRRLERLPGQAIRGQAGREGDAMTAKTESAAPAPRLAFGRQRPPKPSESACACCGN